MATETEEAIVAAIRRQHSVGNKVMFEDPDFGAEDASLYSDVAQLPDYAKVEPRKSQGPHPWLYPTQFTEAPELFKDGVASGDIVQGQLGDCWLLGSMSAVAANGGIERLILSSDEDVLECGVFTAQFYKDGEWHTVTVDTRIPYGDPTSDIFNFPVYARASNPSEMWVMLLQKAYAKFHGAYEKLNGGSVAEALVDLTGGVSQKIVLTEDHIKEMIASGRLWHKIKKLKAKGALLGCSMNVRDGGFEEDSGTGIMINHAYSILHVKEVGRGLKFVKLRNPWAFGEWRGDWCDLWAGWSDHPDVEAALVDDPECDFKRGEDGVFWMIWEDFVAHFNKIYICRVFGEEYNQCAIRGEWKGLSAAGAQRVMADKEETKTAASRPRHMTPVDGDPFWCHNPQFRVTTNTPGKMFVSLMQSDRKRKGVPENVPIRFTITAVKKSNRSRLWVEDPSEIVADSSAYSFSQRFPQREVSHGNIQLDPNFAYIIVPHTQEAGIETGFVLRLFSKSELTVTPLAEPFSLEVADSWTSASAGGAFRLEHKANPTWCINPQYFLASPGAAGVPGNAVVKVVLQRTDRGAGRDDRGDGPKNRVGVVVTRVPPKPIANPRRRRPGQVKTDALGNPLPVMESTLRRTTMDTTVESVEESKEPSLPTRRLEVGAEEFCQCSDLSDASVAETLLSIPTTWLAEGLLVHPCMRLPGREGEYKLSVHSDFEVEMTELAETSFKTVPGSWVKGKSAFGSHLNGDWKKNPAFLLTCFTAGVHTVRITLSRSEELWLANRKTDSVGSMIGFYVVTCDLDRESRLNDGRAGLIAETAFVPMHSVSETLEIDFAAMAGEKKLLILPATFEPDKEGPFHVSVSMDADFELQPHK